MVGSRSLLALGAGLLVPAALARAQPPAPRARVYLDNPVRSPQMTLAPLPLAPAAADRLVHPWLEALSCPATGTAVSTAAPCAPQALARPSTVGDYDFAADDPAFAETSLFHHAARAMVFFRELGLAPPWPVGRPALRLVANVPRAPGAAPAPSAGAAWSDALFVRATDGPGGQPDTIWFGRGALTNLAHDGDVVAHEVTHAVLDPLLPRQPWTLDGTGARNDGEIIDEALADFFTAALTGDPLIAEHAARNAPAAAARSLAVPGRCPQGLTGRRHGDALLLSAALWSIRAATSADEARRLDRALLEALRPPGSVTTVEALLARTLAGLSRTAPALAKRARRELSARGFLPRCARVLPLVPGETLAGASGSFLAPGRNSTGARQLSPGLVQFQVRPPAGTAALRLRLRSDGGPGAAALLVLARPARPIRWRHQATPAHDAPLSLPLEGEGVLRVARVPVIGAGPLFLQVASTGATDGWYDDLAVTYEPAAAPSR